MRATCLALMTVGLLATSGCGAAPTSRVRGTVKQDGKPISAGTVVFFGSTNQPVMADIKPDGTYDAPAVPRGKVRVAVQLPLPSVAPRPESAPARPANADVAADDAGKLARLPPPPEPGAADKPKPAPRFADPNTSGLAFDLGADEFEFRIDLK